VSKRRKSVSTKNREKMTTRRKRKVSMRRKRKVRKRRKRKRVGQYTQLMRGGGIGRGSGQERAHVHVAGRLV
jgi:hypothetical protein